MQLDHLTALSPLDGRYQEKLQALRPYFSEFALFKYRVYIEIEWLKLLLTTPDFIGSSPISSAEQTFLDEIYLHFNEESALKIKEIERTTNHDVKAVEYFIRDQMKQHPTLAQQVHWIHFACTSEDINNLAYACMVQQGLKTVILPVLEDLLSQLEHFAQTYAAVPMLARTHGQPATPTTVGKEFAVFYHRLARQIQQLEQVQIMGKFNGAVGNFNAHACAFPQVDWLGLSEGFIKKLGLVPNLWTTQIEPHDYLAELFHSTIRANSILIDMNRDIWAYISLNYFKQKVVKTEVGSSTMPHKVNPIDFENSEGNLALANAVLGFLAERLTVSRWQRDLVDSTLLRNIGLALGHAYLGWQSCLKGLAKLEVAQDTIADDLKQHPEVLAEAIQTVMRAEGIANAYEQLKDFTRGQALSLELMHAFIASLPLPIQKRQLLQKLLPEHYLGLADSLAKKK